jgi:anti-sigma regulatory factor (Ser/Thr protein kinase)
VLDAMDDEKVVGVTAAYRPLLAESSADSRALALPGAEWRVRVFAGITAQVPEARRFVADALAECPAGPRDALQLCVTELCANAIEHTASGAGGAFLVEVSRPADGVACVAVTDGGAGAPRPWGPGASGAAGDSLDGVDGLAEGGRGLALVAAFSSRWGYHGHTAWAEATWPVPASPSVIPRQGTWEDVDAPATPRGPAA